MTRLFELGMLVGPRQPEDDRVSVLGHSFPVRLRSA